MARNDPILVAFNRGEISTQLLGRTDLEHLRLAAQIMENWQPRVLGPMTLRPGSEYVGPVNQGTVPTTIWPFIAASNDTAVLELQPNQLRVWVIDPTGPDYAITLVTRAAVGTIVPGFGSGNWFVTQQTGTAAVVINAGGVAFGNLNIGANVGVACAVTIASADVGVEHAIRLTVVDGPIKFAIGNTQNDDALFGTETLDTGVYSMAFTPPQAGSIFLQINSAIGSENFNTVSTTQPQGIQTTSVSSISLEPDGPMTLPTPWPASVLMDQPNAAPSIIRETSSADVVFVACLGIPQQQINRYSTTSWSVVEYKSVKGPMSATIGSSAIILSVSDQTGNVSLTSNQPTFSQDDVGTLFRLFHNQQHLTQVLSFNATNSDSVRITGVSTISIVVAGTLIDEPTIDRTFAWLIAGSWTGSVALQRSFSGLTTDYSDYQVITANASGQIVDDGLNNEIVYYRFQLRGSGNATVSILYPGGGGAGVCRVTSYVDPQTLDVEVLVPFSQSGAAFDWHQSEWSGVQGYPTSTAIHEGRLWWAGADRWWGSTSDDYTNFDFDEIGDAAYIDVQVGQGPIANINWLLSLDSLLGGGDTQIIAARSDAIQDPLTPTNFNLRFSTTQGSAAIQAIKIDNIAVFVTQSQRKIFEAIYDLYTYNYKASEISNLNPDIGAPGSAPDAHSGGYIGMAVQRNPDTVISLIRSDGQIVCLLRDLDDDVKAFWRKTTPGTFDNVIVFPGLVEDMVVVTVTRGGQRGLERFARLDECTGDNICKLSDAFFTYTGAPTTTFTAPWLANQLVAVWIDGTDASLTLDEEGNPPAGFTNGLLQLDRGGTGILPTAAQNITAGLQYTANWLSTKLAYAAQQGTAINETKRVDHIGLVLQNTHNLGLRYQSYVINPQQGLGSFGSDFGSDFNSGPDNPLYDNNSPIDYMPRVEEGVILENDLIWAYYDQRRFEFPANSSTDVRILLQAASPRPATVIAMTLEIETND